MVGWIISHEMFSTWKVAFDMGSLWTANAVKGFACMGPKDAGLVLNKAAHSHPDFASLHDSMVFCMQACCVAPAIVAVQRP